MKSVAMYLVSELSSELQLDFLHEESQVCYDDIAFDICRVVITMPTLVLATKLFAPPLRADLVSRPRLFDQLSAGLQRKLTLVSAPAGYGKTTLVTDWLHAADLSSAWLSLDEGDNDLIRFFQCFIAALQRIIPAIGERWAGTSQGGQSVPFDTSLNLLINEITGHPDPFVLVLDDFHMIDSQAVLDMVISLLEHMPAQMHLVVLSRTDPPIPLARLRARNQLIDIRAEQLRFTLDEITVFLNETMLLNLSASDLAAIEARTEGWIASLQLAGLSMQGSQDIHTFITTFAGSHHYIMDYLVEEVLSVQPEKIRSFLLQTSILARMCASLCSAVVNTEEMEEVDGQEMLQVLEQMNLFVISLDNDRQWYRYHHLFADMLIQRLEHLYPDQLPELHLRASQWYGENGFIPESIHHSLEAGNLERTIQLIEENGCLLLIRGEVNTLQKWIEAIEPHAQARPWIHIFKAWLCALTGYPEQVEPMLQIAEKLISLQEPLTDTRIMQGTIATGRAYLTNLQGDTLLTARFARQALECLPAVDLVSRSLRAVAIALFGDASFMDGDLLNAKQAYMESKQICQAAGDVHLVIVANSNLANVIMEQGLLHEAAQIYSETLQLATRPSGQKLVIAGRLCMELSQVSYEWNDLKAAAQQARQCLALCQQWGNVDLQAVAYVMLAQLEQVQRHPEKAQEAIRSAEQLIQQHRLLPKYVAWTTHALGKLWIAEGNLEKAAHWIEESGIAIDDPEIPYLREPDYLILLRLLLFQEDYDAALRLSERLLQQAETARRIGRVIEVLVLQAIIFQGNKEIDQALLRLRKALSIARVEEYMRTFLDEGEAMAKLLHLAKARGIETDYVTALLAAIGEVNGESPSPVHLLTEPLSGREVEILKLIETGCSNQEIADTLVISIATVKRHISNIYAKLGVQSRTQAVSIGRELGLFR